jgi:hypothetical protein
MLIQRRFTAGDDHPLQKTLPGLQKGKEIMVARSGPAIPGGYQIGVVAVGAFEIAA